MKCVENTTLWRDRQAFWKVVLEFKTALGGETILTKRQCFSRWSDLSLHWAQVCPETASPQFAQQLQVQQSVCPATAK